MQLLSSVRSAHRTRASTPGHRYWGIRINSSGGGNFAIGDLELYIDLDKGNLALGTTTSQDSGLTNSGSTQGPTKISDGMFGANAGNWGVTTATAGVKIWADLGTKRVINVARLIGIEIAFVSALPTAFDVISSDDAITWNTEWSVTTTWDTTQNYEVQTYRRTGNVADYSGEPFGLHTYWRLLMLGNHGTGNGFAIAESEFRATPGGSDQTGSGTASDSDHFSSPFTAAMAFDHNSATMWVTVGDSNIPPAGSHWMQYQFTTPVKLAEVTAQGRNDAFYEQSPTQFMVQYSDNGTDFFNAWKGFSATAYGSSSAIKTFTDPDYV